ncbi:MAG: DUF167 domain-containing protein [Candidatus Berkelbacteria bacterium]|nr:DUF167 domain-containing protein [Candidatus Berkelbacteria bacterium]
MEIKVRVKPKSGRSKVIKNLDRFLVYTASDSRNGKANDELVKLIAGEFGVGCDKIKIVRGRNTPNKKLWIDI